MWIDRHRKKSRPSPDTPNLSDGVNQVAGGCKILPFRQKTNARETLGAEEFVQGSVAVDPVEPWSLEEGNDVPVVCVPEWRQAGSSHLRSSVVVPRWLKTVLLAGAFTAWTSITIALALALS